MAVDDLDLIFLSYEIVWMRSFVLGVGENGGEVGFSCELGSQSCQHPQVTLLPTI